MDETTPTVDIDFDRLAEHLSTLSYGNRLELLAILQKPRELGEIHLTPSKAQAGDNPDRPISRQAVHNHLTNLIDAGLIRADEGSSEAKRYVVDQAALYALAEDFRELSRLQPTEDVDVAATRPVGEDESARDWTPGPKLVLVRGVDEGRVHPLRRSDIDGDRGWVIGRADRADIQLDFDPYVSSENSEIVPTEDGHQLIDLRVSRNGTYLNWRKLPIGEPADLSSGDVIGVGRSLLLFRED